MAKPSKPEQHNIYIGCDARQPVSYTALQMSLILGASKPIGIHPLVLHTLPLTVHRPIPDDLRGLTPFTYSRYLVPWLSGFEGWSLFMDADMLALGDITEIWKEVDDSKSVMVVKEQPKFEWPSLMLFNNAKLKHMTPEYVKANVKTLYQMDWAKDGVGELDPRWNFCVGYRRPKPEEPQPWVVHYTQGVPGFPELRGCPFSDEWHEFTLAAVALEPYRDLMGTSVHVEHLPDGSVVPKLKLEEIREQLQSQEVSQAQEPPHVGQP